MKIAIVGGAGKMGRWLARALVADGQQVTLVDWDKARLEEAGRLAGVDATTDLSAVSGAGALLLAVPINSFEEVVRGIAPFATAGQVALDVSSVKVMPVEVMHRYLPGCLVLGTHPVFGPGADGVAGQNVVLTPTTEAESDLADRLKKLLEGRGAAVSLMTPQKHDELMAVVLGLAHFVAIVAGDTLLGLDRIQELAGVSGPTFRALLSLISSVLHEDPALYAAIQLNLPALPALEQVFTTKAGEWAEMVQNRDAAAFARRMSALRRALEEQQNS